MLPRSFYVATIFGAVLSMPTAAGADPVVIDIDKEFPINFYVPGPGPGGSGGYVEDGPPPPSSPGLVDGVTLTSSDGAFYIGLGDLVAPSITMQFPQPVELITLMRRSRRGEGVRWCRCLEPRESVSSQTIDTTGAGSFGPPVTFSNLAIDTVTLTPMDVYQGEVGFWGATDPTPACPNRRRLAARRGAYLYRDRLRNANASAVPSWLVRYRWTFYVSLRRCGQSRWTGVRRQRGQCRKPNGRLAQRRRGGRELRLPYRNV